MSDLRKHIEEEGYRFNFFQAIRLLESVHPDRPNVGELGPFEKEVIRIRPSKELCFSPSDVRRIDQEETEDGDPFWRLCENFLGLYGPNGATPIYIAEVVAQCIDDDDPFRDFLDIFNHRIISLYYRAWKKHKLTACVSQKRDDAISVALCALIGQDAAASSEGWLVEPKRLLRYASLLSSASRSAAGLANIIEDYFCLENVKIIQFVPRRIRLSGLTQNQIGGAGTGGQLGESFVLGDTINDITGQFKICIADLAMERFDDFQPGRQSYNELVFLTNLYTQRRLDFSLELTLRAEQAGPLLMSAETPVGELGRSSWIGRPTEQETTVVLDVEA